MPEAQTFPGLGGQRGQLSALGSQAARWGRAWGGQERAVLPVSLSAGRCVSAC